MVSRSVVQSMILWQRHVLNLERSMKMQDEETLETPEKEPEVTAEEEKEHDAVGPGGKCWCGWTFGKDISPHIVVFGSSRNEPELPPEPKKFVGKEPDPNACPAIAPQAKCPKCGWSGADPSTRDNPHPILV